jgi:m7GpppX diphosphatase
LKQDTRSKCINLLGQIDSTPAILIAEKNAFDVTTTRVTKFSHDLHLPEVSLLDRNDIYHWFLASQSAEYGQIKLTLIYPATEAHVRKYTYQRLRMVVETGEIYRERVRPFVEEKGRGERLMWVYNILEHKAERDRVILEDPDERDGFILLPDLSVPFLITGCSG